MSTTSEDLTPLSLGAAALAAAAFALGVCLVFVVDPLGLRRAYSDMFDFLWFVPLVITPLTYVPAFLFLEVSIRWRSPRQQIIAAAVAGLAFMLVVAALMRVADALAETLVFDDWIGMGVMWLVALSGPFAVAWALAPVERRLAKRMSRAS